MEGSGGPERDAPSSSKRHRVVWVKADNGVAASAAQPPPDAAEAIPGVRVT